MAQLSSNFRAHFLSALARSLFTNSSQIFTNSVFVNTVGGKSYSDLFFFASLFTIIYYVYFAIRGERQAYLLYKTVLILCLIGLLLFLAYPLCKVVLYYFAIAVVVVDLIGTNLGPIVLQASVNPAIFRELFQRIVSVELLARISAAGAICLLSQFHLPQCYYALAAGTLIAHFVLFGSILSQINTEPQVEQSKNPSSLKFVDSISSSLRFVLSNPLARIALTIMVWTHVTKFLVEYLFYQVAASNFQTAAQIASFVSATTMTMIVISLLVQRAVGKQLTERLQLSTLFSIQPINILLLGSVALLTQPFWPLVFLMVSYQCINRSIQLPVSRQCLLPIPRAQRGSIASLFSLFMAIAALITSGIMSVLKSSLGLHDFLIVLLFLSGILFFLITRMDAYYIRNLWSFFREGRSGTWPEMPFASGLCTDGMAPAAPSKGSADAESHRIDLASNSILHTYACACDRSSLARVSAEHRGLLNSGQAQSVLLGLRVSFVAGFPWSSQASSPSPSATDATTGEFIAKAQKVNTNFKNMHAYSSIFRRKIKTLALEFLESKAGESDFLLLHNVLQLADHNAAELVIDAMSRARFKEMQSLLLNCVSADNKRVSLKPIIENMSAKRYQDAIKYRELLERLSGAKDNSELLLSIKSGIELLRQAEFSVWAHSPDDPGRRAYLERFMHTLFLEEYRLSRHGLDRTFTDTISEFAILSKEEALLLVDMHLEYLKTSELFSFWVALVQKPHAEGVTASR